MKKKITPFLVLLFSLSFTSFWLFLDSGFEPVRAIYFWENNRSRLTKKEAQLLDKLAIQKMYVKFFEVEKNDALGIFPTAKSELTFHPNTGQKMEIIPTIYIRNTVFKNVDQDELLQLADNLLFLIQKRYKLHFPHIKDDLKEIQIDCDWTESTKDNYHFFLRALNNKSDVTISATLRLYAYKFPAKMGVLPVDRAMLMCYNLLSPANAGNRNSILDLNELEKYLIGADTYPIPLDVALPIYSAVHIYQSDQLRAIFYEEDKLFLQHLKHKKGLWYTMKHNVLIPGTYIRKGDHIKYENITPNVLKRAITIIRENVNLREPTTVALYHLNEFELNQYSYEELDAFYSDFSH